MITLPNGLNAFMKGQKLDGLKPFALLYRNKWDSVNNKYALEDTPIDISALIAKPNTLSMTLDVNEVAQYNANNVTLTLADTKNYFVEGTPNSYFPEGYQIYGSRIVLYYGTDGVNRTPLFTGVIKDLPTHKPENYQVDVKLVSPLEMLKDIEAKDFSDKVTGETLTYKSTDSDGHRIYWTTGMGVGGFDAVYADGTKLFEGVDYETDQLNALGLPAIVTIINSNYYSSTITADYYTWKTGLTVEQIVAGLVGLAGYDSGTEDIRNVVWNTLISNRYDFTPISGLGYKNINNTSYENSYFEIDAFGNFWRGLFAPKFFKVNLKENDAYFRYSLGDNFPQKPGSFTPINGMSVYADTSTFLGQLKVSWFINGAIVRTDILFNYLPTDGFDIEIFRNDNVFTISATGKDLYGNVVTNSTSYTNDFTIAEEYAEWAYTPVWNYNLHILNSSLQEIGTLNENFTLLTDSVVVNVGQQSILKDFNATFSGTTPNYSLFYRVGEQSDNMGEWKPASIGEPIGETATYFQFKLVITNQGTTVSDMYATFLVSRLTLQLVNLSGLTVLEALQDFALISGYEFGVDRQGVFFFRPRVSSTTPTYILDHDEIVKVDTVKKNLSDFFTKLTLTFAQVPLEFYANTGERPTLVDKYGIINKEIDKPDIVNYDNPELAQAIGPQLLEVYSALPNIIQVTGKLNLALELGDIVSLRRNMNLITPEGYTDYSKYTDLNTYYRACKITGMNYNFSKRQITYTLRDVSNKNTEPQYEFNEYIYDLAVQYGVKE